MPSFKAPKGFNIPEGVEVDEEFQAMGTFIAKGKGKLTITQVDGLDIPGYEKDSKEKKKKTQSYADKVAEEAPVQTWVSNGNGMSMGGY